MSVRSLNVICALVAAGSDYTIRLTHCDCAACVQDVSDSAFTITGAAGGSLLTLNAPNGGEVWYLVGLNEGHGFQKRDNIDYYQWAVAMFLEKLKQ